MATCGIPKQQCGLEPQEPDQDHSIYKLGPPQPTDAQRMRNSEGETKMAKKWTERGGLAAPGGTSGNRDQRADGDRSSPAAQAHGAGPPSGGGSFLPSALFQGVSAQHRAQLTQSLEFTAQQ